MRKYLTFVGVFFLMQVGYGQSSNLNNLLVKLASAKEDTNKVSLLLDIQKRYFSTDLDSSLYYNKLCEKLITQINAQDYKHKCFHEFVKIYHAKADFANALAYCKLSLKAAEENKNQFQAAASYRAIFNVYHNLKMNDSAVKYAVYSIKLTTEIGDTNNIATNYGNLCWLYLDMSQYDQAENYGLKGTQAGAKYKDTVGLLIAINNLALCYLRTNKNSEAIALLNRQIIIGKKVNRARSVRNALINIATIHYNTSNAPALRKTAEELENYNDEDENLDEKNKCTQYLINGYKFILLKDFVKAEASLLVAMKIAEGEAIDDQLSNIYSTLTKIKFAQLDFLKSKEYEDKWYKVADSANELQLAQYAADLETKYETEKKSNKILLQAAQLKEKSILNYFLIGSGLSLLIISILSYRTYKQKQKLQQQQIADLETQQQLTATEAVLKGEEQERTRLAKDLHDGLGGMLSGIKYSFNTMKGNLIMTQENAQAFERSMDMLDTSIKEMRRVAHNMMPEALVKFGLDTALKDFCNDINSTGVLHVSYQSIDLENVMIEQTTSITIYRIVQELINNSIKHAGATNAIVQLTKANDILSVTVEDDGKGFDKNILTASKGIGWSNIQNRVEFLKATLDVKTEKGKGTSVLVELPLPES